MFNAAAVNLGDSLSAHRFQTVSISNRPCSIWLRVGARGVLAHSDSRIRRISPFSQNPLPGSCCERLSAGYNSVGAMDDTPPAGEGDEIRLELGVYGF